MKKRGQMGLLFASTGPDKHPATVVGTRAYGEECKTECDLLRVRVIAINGE